MIAILQSWKHSHKRQTNCSIPTWRWKLNVEKQEQQINQCWVHFHHLGFSGCSSRWGVVDYFVCSGCYHSYKSLSEPSLMELLFPCCVPMVTIDDPWLWTKCLPLPINWIFFSSELNINVAGSVRTHWSVYCYELMLKYDEELICYVEDQYGRETAPGQLHFYPMHEIWMHLLLVP